MNKLSLKGSLSEVVTILEWISLPGSATLSLHCPNHDPVDGLLNTLISLLATHFWAPETTVSPLSTMMIGEVDFASSLTIIAWDTIVPLPLPHFIIPFTSAHLHLTFGS